MRQTNSSAALSAVVYRSRAVTPLSGHDLQGLMQAAQARNRREAVTGVMLYDESHFYQWLEGPADGVSRVMHSIRGDPRHTDIEILSHAPASARRFGDWDMKLATRGMDLALRHSEVVKPPPEILDGLRQHPHRAAGFLLRLVDVASSLISPFSSSDRFSSRATMVPTTASVLRATFLDVVVPKLLDRHRPAASQLDPEWPFSQAAELAELLIASDEGASLQLIRELRGKSRILDGLYAPLFEPAARKLGDLWTNDICSEFEVTLGLARLQTAARLLGMDAPRPPRQKTQSSVLIVPAPGEMHQLVASLDTEWLWSRGWAPRQDFPADNRALEDLVSGAWIDVLDLSLSAAFRRQDRLQNLRQTVTLARRASRNSALLVVVGGRVFAECRGADCEVGADLASPTSQDLDRRLLTASVARARAGS